MTTTTVSIPGIHCAACATLIKDVSSEFPQIQQANVDIETKNVTIEHDDSFDLAAWTAEIENLGDTYKVQSAA